MPPANLPHQHHESSLVLLQNLPQAQEFQAVAGLFHQLGDSNRLRLFWILCHSEECLVNLAAMMDMTSPALSHHLRQLKESGLVVSRRAGKEVYYRAAPSATAELLHHFMEQLNHVVCPQADPPSAPPSAQIQAVHDLLTADLSRRYTIDQLAHRFFMDSSTLKQEFRRSYGLPIATYLKEQRMKKAMALLMQTDLPVGEIASQVGYETQSKFTAAFRSATQMSPSEYRKASRNG